MATHINAGQSRGFLWCKTAYEAIISAARLDGYSALVAEPKAAVTKERVAAKLAEFTDEELAEMGLTRKKVKR